MKAANVTNGPRDYVLTEKIDDGVVIPWSRDFLIDLKGFVAFLDDSVMVSAVVHELVVHSSCANRLTISQDDGPGGIRGNDVAAFNAAGHQSGANHSTHEAHALPHLFPKPRVMPRSLPPYDKEALL